MRAPGSGDAAVRETNDDAQISKMSCIRAGYFEDEFLKLFVRRGSAKRAPLINRGYFARAFALKQLAQQFLKAGSPKAVKQVLSLGAGYDTNWFQLKASGQNVRYFETDFPEVTRRKAEIIVSNPQLQVLLEGLDPMIDLERGSMKSNQYNLVPGDLREFDGVLLDLQSAGLRHDLPTLVLAECVLVYLPPESSQQIVSRLGETLQDAAFVVYEQIKPYDAFGKQMMLNLESRGCPLIGIHGTPDLERQKLRFTRHSWQRAWAADMDAVYMQSIPVDEKRRIERLEIFDELEEWHLIQEHYCIAVGINDAHGLLKDFSLPHHPQHTSSLAFARLHGARQLV